MNVRKVIRKRVRRTKGSTQLAGDLNAVIAANVGESGGRTSVSSRQRIVQRTGTEPERSDESTEDDLRPQPEGGEGNG